MCNCDVRSALNALQFVAKQGKTLTMDTLDRVPISAKDESKWDTAACCAVLCCAVLCCAVLCCAVLCCAVLCCAVLCCVVIPPF